MIKWGYIVGSVIAKDKSRDLGITIIKNLFSFKNIKYY